jgi:hypothetical protein
MADIRQSSFWANLAKKVARILLKNAGLGGRPDTNHQHVVPHPEGWSVKGEGNERYTAIYDKRMAKVILLRALRRRASRCCG